MGKLVRMQRSLKKYVPIILPIYPLAVSVVLIDVEWLTTMMSHAGLL